MKYLDCVGLAGLPTEDLLALLGLGLDVLGGEADWSLCCLGKKEAEVVLIVLFDDVSGSLLVSVLEVEDWLSDFLRLVLLKRSSMDFCLILFASCLPLLPWGLGILTGEPLMLIKALVLPTDLFTGGFCPVEVAGLMEGNELEIPLLARPE